MSLPKNAEWLGSAHAEVIIVNSAGDVRNLREFLTTCSYPGIRLLHLDGVQHFNKSECLNIGAFFSRTDWVFTLDADIILVADFLETGLKLIDDHDSFATIKEVVEVGPDVRMHSSDPRGAIVQRIITTQVVHENGHSATIEYSVDKRNPERRRPGAG